VVAVILGLDMRSFDGEYVDGLERIILYLVVDWGRDLMGGSASIDHELNLVLLWLAWLRSWTLCQPRCCRPHSGLLDGRDKPDHKGRNEHAKCECACHGNPAAGAFRGSLRGRAGGASRIVLVDQVPCELGVQESRDEGQGTLQSLLARESWREWGEL